MQVSAKVSIGYVHRIAGASTATDGTAGPIAGGSIGFAFKLGQKYLLETGVGWWISVDHTNTISFPVGLKY